MKYTVLILLITLTIYSLMNTINFMYFAHNFSLSQMEQIFFELDNVRHFKDKFINANGSNGTEKFFKWFMMLSIDNMLIVTNWIETNYKNL